MNRKEKLSRQGGVSLENSLSGSERRDQHIYLFTQQLTPFACIPISVRLPEANISQVFTTQLSQEEETNTPQKSERIEHWLWPLW